MTTEPDEPTVIIPTRACWASHAKRAHLPHIFGTPPNVWRCTGTVHASLEHDREIFTPDATEWPDPKEPA